MPYSTTIETAAIQQWMAARMEPKAIEEELVSKGLDADAVAAYLKEYKRAVNSKRQFNGFLCMGAGAFLGFISCVLTIINPVPELYNLILYGLTSVSILVVFLGLYFVFE